MKEQGESDDEARVLVLFFEEQRGWRLFFYFVSDDDGGGDGRCVFEQGGSKQGARLCECRKMTSVERRTSSKSSCEKRN